MLIEPPSVVVDVVGSVDGWELTDPTNDRQNRTWLTERHAIKAVPLDRQDELVAAALNSRWLSQFVSVAPVVVEAADETTAWLVTDRLPGVPSHRPDLHGDVGSLAEVAGNALRELHAIPVEAAPGHLERGWEAIEATAEASVAAGIEQVDEPYQRYTGAELLELWRSGRPASEDLVVCHGDPALPNLMAHQGRFTGWVDLGAVCVADRHLDLAHAHLSVHHNLGPEAVYIFYDTYGADPDLLRLDHYLLAKQLLP